MERFLAVAAVAYIAVKALRLLVKELCRKKAERELTRICVLLEKMLDH